MRHNLFLSALLLGASILVTGCGGGGSSDSGSGTQQTGNGGDSQQTGNGGGTQNPSGQNDNNGTTAAGAKLTLDMLKAKTFYTYGIDRIADKTEYRFVIEFNADASGFNIHNFPGSDSTFSVDGTNSVSDGIMRWHADGDSVVTTALKIYADGSFLAQSDETSHFDPYPKLFSSTKLADKGQSVYDAFMADQTLEKQALVANPWYWVSWSYDNDDNVNVDCKSMRVFGADNSVGYSFVKNGSTVTKNDAGTYVVSGNTLETDISIGEEVRHSSFTPVLITADKILWKDGQAFFKNRADAVTFVENMGADAGCYDHFPPQQ